MPSDNLTELVLAGLEGPRNAFTSNLSAAAEQVRGTLAGLSADVETRNDLLKTQLGGFAAGRINIEKFSTFADGQKSVSAAAVPALKAAQQALLEMVEAGKELNKVRVAAGKNVRCGVRRGLKKVGRAFGAARVIEMAKAGTYNEAEHGHMLEGLDFGEWNPAERAMAPPLVVHVNGRSLHTAALSEFMDGGVKLVLLIDGPCSPAVLARLIAPGTFVMQCEDASAVDKFAEWNGHGVVAIVPPGSAAFTFAPIAGQSLADSLTITALPDDANLSPLGSMSVKQQAAELELLAALTGANATPQEENDAPPANPVDQLAAFLLNKANLEEV